MNKQRCQARYNGYNQCSLPIGHLGVHECSARVSWADDSAKRIAALEGALREALQHIDDPDVVRGLSVVLDG